MINVDFTPQPSEPEHDCKSSTITNQPMQMIMALHFLLLLFAMIINYLTLNNKYGF